MAVSRTAPNADSYVSEDSFDVEARPEQATTQTSVGAGWEAAETLTSASADYPVEFKHSETFQLIKFLDQSGPFATYKQHFLKQKTEGRRSYVCLGANCPLCVKLNDKPEDKRAFTVVNLTTLPATRQMLIATPRLYKTLHAAEFSPQGPLTKNYWAINRTGKMQQTVYNLMAVKARDLGEDYGLDVETVEKQIAEFSAYDRSFIKEHTYAELLEIAQDLA